jgi:DNA-binding NtrC family response regulator
LTGGYSTPGVIGTVLVADSDYQSLYETCKAFRNTGYRCFGTTTFAEATQVIFTEKPHILVADVRLGEHNGLQLLMLAKEIQPGITIVITNAFQDPALSGETRRLGGTFMVKPIDATDLLEAARIAMKQGDRRRADRRVLHIPEFRPDRRVTDRRKA